MLEAGKAFEREYLHCEGPFEVIDVWSAKTSSDQHWSGTIVLRHLGVDHRVDCSGTGPIDGLVRALRTTFGVNVEVGHYSEHALTQGAQAEAVTYIQLIDTKGSRRFGVGRDSNIVIASLKALVSAANRLSTCEQFDRVRAESPTPAFA